MFQSLQEKDDRMPNNELEEIAINNKDIKISIATHLAKYIPIVGKSVSGIIKTKVNINTKNNVNL